MNIIGDYYNNDGIEEFNRCPIYFDNEIIGERHWILSIIFLSDNNSNQVYLHLFNGVYKGKGILDSDIKITRISLFKPEYIILPDTHYQFNKEDLQKFISIIDNNWSSIVSTLLNEMKYLYEMINFSNELSKPDYSLLPTND